MAGPWEQFQQVEAPELPWMRYATQPEPESQKLRSAMQGFTFGFADEIEALARSAVPGSPNYETIRNELRNKLRSYQEANPGAALSMEVLGAAIPTAVAVLTGVGGAPAVSAQSARMVPTLAKAAKFGAVEGGIAGYGTGEKGIIEDIARIPGGAAVGAVAGAGTTAALRPAGAIFNNLINYGRTKFGDKAASVVDTEIRRLADATGLPPDEIVQRVADGTLMSENETLLATVRAYRSRPGEASSIISRELPLRRIQTRQEAMDALQRGLAPNAGPSNNIYRAMRMSEDEFKRNESSAYNQIFEQKKEISLDTIDAMTEAMVRTPDARTRLDEVYKARGNLVPFYKIDDAGKIKIVRAPTLEDAEIVRRAVAESVDDAFRTGRKSVGESLKDVENNLRTRLNVESPELEATRANWRQINVARDSFEKGRKIIGRNADEVEDEFLRLKDLGNVEAIRAYRAGAMDAIRNRARRSPGLMSNLADPERQEGAILRIVFPEDEVQGVIDLAGRAGRAQRAEQVVMQGSMTAPEQAAGAQIGSRFSMEEAARVVQGDPLAMVSAGVKMARSLVPEMTDQQRAQVVSVLLSDDPDIVRRALFDDTAFAEFQRQIMRLGGAAAEGTRRGMSIQAGEVGGQISGGLLNNINGAEQ